MTYNFLKKSYFFCVTHRDFMESMLSMFHRIMILHLMQIQQRLIMVMTQPLA